MEDFEDIGSIVDRVMKQALAGAMRRFTDAPGWQAGHISKTSEGIGDGISGGDAEQGQHIGGRCLVRMGAQQRDETGDSFSAEPDFIGGVNFDPDGLGKHVTAAAVTTGERPDEIIKAGAVQRLAETQDVHGDHVRGCPVAVRSSDVRQQVLLAQDARVGSRQSGENVTLPAIQLDRPFAARQMSVQRIERQFQVSLGLPLQQVTPILGQGTASCCARPFDRKTHDNLLSNGISSLIRSAKACRAAANRA